MASLGRITDACVRPLPARARKKGLYALLRPDRRPETCPESVHTLPSFTAAVQVPSAKSHTATEAMPAWEMQMASATWPNTWEKERLVTIHAGAGRRHCSSFLPAVSCGTGRFTAHLLGRRGVIHLPQLAQLGGEQLILKGQSEQSEAPHEPRRRWEVRLPYHFCLLAPRARIRRGGRRAGLTASHALRTRSNSARMGRRSASSVTSSSEETSPARTAAKRWHTHASKR